MKLPWRKLRVHLLPFAVPSREFREGTQIPWMYGICWYNHYRRCEILTLVPLNLVYRWARGFYLWVAWELKDNEVAYQAGLQEGKRIGWGEAVKAQRAGAEGEGRWETVEL